MRVFFLATVGRLCSILGITTAVVINSIPFVALPVLILVRTVGMLMCFFRAGEHFFIAIIAMLMCFKTTVVICRLLIGKERKRVHNTVVINIYNGRTVACNGLRLNGRHKDEIRLSISSDNGFCSGKTRLRFRFPVGILVRIAQFLCKIRILIVCVLLPIDDSIVHFPGLPYGMKGKRLRQFSTKRIRRAIHSSRPAHKVIANSSRLCRRLRHSAGRNKLGLRIAATLSLKRNIMSLLRFGIEHHIARSQRKRFNLVCQGCFRIPTSDTLVRFHGEGDITSDLFSLNSFFGCNNACIHTRTVQEEHIVHLAEDGAQFDFSRGGNLADRTEAIEDYRVFVCGVRRPTNKLITVLLRGCRRVQRITLLHNLAGQLRAIFAVEGISKIIRR